MDELINVAKALVPAIAPALRVPKIASDVISSISHILFGEDRQADEVAKGLTTATPEQLLAIQDLKNKFSIRMLEIDNEDRANARNLQVEALHQDDKTSKHFIYYFAWFWSIAAVTYIFGTTFLDVPTANVRVVDTTLGFILGTVVAAILQYFYGSSAGSRAKDKPSVDVLK